MAAEMEPLTRKEIAGESPSSEATEGDSQRRIDTASSVENIQRPYQFHGHTIDTTYTPNRSLSYLSGSKMATEMDALTEKEIAGMSPSSEATEGGSQRSIDTTSSIENTKRPYQFHDHTVDINFTPNSSLSYLFENIEDYLNLAVPLYEASIIGDWEAAKNILDERPDLIRVGLSRNLGTALHVAVTAEETKVTINFVKNLVNMMTVEELELQNRYSNTAFWIASAGGNTKMAMIMMEKNRRLPDIRGTAYMPLHIAAMTGTNSIVKYLYENSQKMRGDNWTENDRNLALMHCVERDFFDVALQIVEDHPELKDNMSILEVLSRKPDAINEVEKNNLFMRIIKPSFRFLHNKVQPDVEEDNDALKLLKTIWGHATRTMCIDEIEDILDKPPTFAANETIIESSRILLVAAEMGNTRFIVELLRTYPDLMLYENEDGLTLFHVAVMHRHQGIYNLLYEIGGSNNDICLSVDKSGNNMLHLVGKSSKEMAAKTSGASLLMQRELLWFKEVEKMMPPYMREARNNDGQTPYELFSKENEELLSRGLKWMKVWLLPPLSSPLHLLLLLQFQEATTKIMHPSNGAIASNYYILSTLLMGPLQATRVLPGNAIQDGGIVALEMIL
ncbi:uncharacterized protein LOC143613247 [Bidens hawaiensis]|uniref:uncharacterized protein LOC143613247 n=1 Tax=Bidens hawaiensis TaxID=980011 RepID=UPI004049894D